MFLLSQFEFLSTHHAAMNEKIVSVITRKLLLGVEHMHAHNIVHRDLKPENVLIAFNDKREIVVKICDFGLAYFMPPVNDAHSCVASTAVNSAVSGVTGSAGFFAPECVLSVSEYW
jgi:serine/threonine protein kinase